MSETLRIQIEHGPKGKRFVAVAPDWPGLARGDKTPEAAVERLRAYVPRYAPVAELAGLAGEFAALSGDEIVEHYPGPGSTDFWGISYAFSSIDQTPLTPEELRRSLSLLRASWVYFDQVRERVSAELKKGPRGGGRDRDQIVNHLLYCEVSWKPRPKGTRPPEQLPLTEPDLSEHRREYIAAIEQLHAEGKTAGKWPLPYMIRHTAFHTLDHTWEMEDKDLSSIAGE